MTTPTMIALVVLVVVVELGLWARGRLAAAQRQRAGLEAFREQLGIPAGRFTVVDVGLATSLRRALPPWRRLPRFEHVHRTRDPRLLAAAEARVAAAQHDWTPAVSWEERA